VNSLKNDALLVSLFIASALHAVVFLGLGFVSFANAITAPPTLEVILVQPRDSEAPEEADYIAQVSQDGGGESADNTRPSSLFASDRDFDTDGVAQAPALKSAPEESEATADEVLTAVFSDTETLVDTESEEAEDNVAEVDKVVIVQNLDIARLAAEIDRQMEATAKRPRKMHIHARTRESSSAEYMKYWVEKVERVGNLNYPDAARRASLTGALIMTVGILRNGEIESISVSTSSGEPVLDDAAKRIVELSGPYEPLQGKLAEEADIIYITRTWEFTGDENVTTY
jgi:protein TonB